MKLIGKKLIGLIFLSQPIFVATVSATPPPNQTAILSTYRFPTPYTSPPCRTGGTFTTFISSPNVKVFPEVGTIAQGGVLCPGKYIVQSGYCSIGTGNDCGGGSCGYGANIYVRASNGGNGPQLIGYNGHDGCQESHGNVCENQQDVHIIFSMNQGRLYIDTNTDTIYGLNANIYNEDGNYNACSITVYASTLYTTPGTP